MAGWSSIVVVVKFLVGDSGSVFGIGLLASHDTFHIAEVVMTIMSLEIVEIVSRSYTSS